MGDRTWTITHQIDQPGGTPRRVMLVEGDPPILGGAIRPRPCTFPQSSRAVTSCDSPTVRPAVTRGLDPNQT